MATIKAIDGQTVHRIQSGQVVVDLCSVIKELVENSLDAGATVIDARFKNQGLDLIEVQDNGSGISSANYHFIALKHHTSKLSTYDDIGTLETFGFRGEALASLCALSAMTVTTCLAEEAPKGSKITFEPSGKLKDVTVVAAQRGTTVSVENLFHNLPVRRRELERNIKREWQKVIALLNQYACIQTNLKFSVSQQPTKGRKISLFSTKGNITTRDNIINIFGAKAAQGLVALDLSLEVTPSTARLPLQAGLTKTDGSTQVKVVGHVSRPTHGDGRQTPDRQMFFVNSRPCSLPQFAKVFNEVYRSYNASQSPFILADIQLDTHLYDVNVSPDKRTILLHEQNHLLETLRSSLTELFDTQDQTVPTSQLLRTPNPATRVGDVRTVTSQATSVQAPTLIYTTSATRSKILGSTKPSEAPRASTVQAKASLFSKPALPLRQERDTSQSVKTSPFEQWLAGQGSKSTQSSSGKGASAEDSESAEEPSSESESESERSQLADDASDSRDGNVPQERTSSKRRLDTEEDVAEDADDVPEDDEPPAKRQHTRATVAMVQRNSSSPADEDLSYSKQPPLPNTDRDVSPDGVESFNIGNETKEHAVQQEEDQQHEQRAEEEGGEEEEADDNDPSATHTEDEEATPAGSPADTQIEEAVNEKAQASHSANTKVISPISPKEKKKPRPATTPALLQPSYRRKGAPMSLVQNLSLDENALQSRMQLWADLGSERDHPLQEKQQVEDITAPDAEAKLPLIIAKSDFGKMRVAGQFNLGFIIAVRPKENPQDSSQHDELFIIDQHASDEKYNFERLQDTTVVQSQRLVVPKQLDLTALEEEIIMQSTKAIEANGFKIDVDMDGEYPVGQRCQLTALPLSRDTTFSLTDLEELISLLGDESAEARIIPRPSKVRKMFAMRACRSSVMIGKPLTLRQMYSLMNHMGELDKPWNCPHGRPTMRHLCRLDTWDSAGWNRDTDSMSKATWSAFTRGE